MAAQVPTPPPVPCRPRRATKVVKPGVTVTGIPLAGRTQAQAIQRCASSCAAAQRRFAVRVGRRSFTLTTGRLRLRLGEKATARPALRAKGGAKVAPVVAFRAASLSASPSAPSRSTAATAEREHAHHPDRIVGRRRATVEDQRGAGGQGDPAPAGRPGSGPRRGAEVSAYARPSG